MPPARRTPAARRVATGATGAARRMRRRGGPATGAARRMRRRGRPATGLRRHAAAAWPAPRAPHQARHCRSPGSRRRLRGHGSCRWSVASSTSSPGDAAPALEDDAGGQAEELGGEGGDFPFAFACNVGNEYREFDAEDPDCQQEFAEDADGEEDPDFDPEVAFE
ncbi:hypothetical protein BDA96_10G076500 [Sorghum bicolor]|uniref:Uncharacterized protein n=1 Tax=Sorghum bicolor TaxID=4558 RepID=A0A921U093_SORBI|nr:hypothetical protein BDA96_10G076500 [Sorghum bicolor]